ncbi:MAG: DUF6786 family protein [Thermoproteota archaeon]
MTIPLKRNDIVRYLSEVSKYVELDCEVGSTIVTEYGARILGIFIKDKENPLWVARNLKEAISRRDWNIGGNRLWVSPERNFFYKKPTSFEEWFCQQQLDPGNWTIMSSGKRSVTLEESLELEDLLNETKTSISLSRQVSSSGSNIRRNLDYVKLKIREAMIAKNNVKSGLNLWSLTQIRPGKEKGGTILVPTRPRAEPVHYFGKIPRDRLKVSRDHISFKIDGMAVYKLGVRPENMPNPGSSSILYYVGHSRDNVFLISMSTKMSPDNQEECLDVAKANPLGPKGCVQSYNSGSDMQFGEMELHFKPAAKVGGSLISCVEYDLEVYAGSRGEVMRVLRKIVPKPFLF